MTEKELLSKLNNLKEFKPDAAWKQQNRDILLSQISGSTNDEKVGFFAILENLMSQKFTAQTARPVWVFVSIAVIVLTGGALGLRAANETKPGDSLYIAKRISEKTQLALTFGDEKKAKLNLEFAGNRAEEIAKVVEGSDQGKTEAIEELTSNFKKEITEAKTRLSKVDGKSEVRVKEEKKEEKKDQEQKDKEGRDDEDDTKVFGANLEKESTGMQLAEQPKAEEREGNKMERNFSEVEKLFEQKDYRGAKGKISELNKFIDNPKTEDKAATSTDGVKEDKKDEKIEDKDSATTTK